MKGTVLVTGASGFIGRSLVGTLAGDGFAVRAAARDPESIAAKAGIERVALARSRAPGRLVAAARRRDPCRASGRARALARRACRRCLIRASTRWPPASLRKRRARAKVERLVLVSSVRAQAGLSADHAITETDVPAPTDAYGRSKLEAERLIEASGAGLHRAPPRGRLRARRQGQYRLARHAGEDADAASLRRISTIAARCSRSKISSRRSRLCSASERAANETFLVADAEPISVANLVSAMREGLGRRPSPRRRAARRREAADEARSARKPSGSAFRAIS